MAKMTAPLLVATGSCMVRGAAASHMRDMAAAPLILALGDSLIAGYGLARGDGLPAQLEARLQATYPGARVIDAGVSGDTSAAVLARLPRALAALPGRPDLVLVQVGPNDVLRGVAPARLRANLDAILLELGRCGVPVLLTAVEPPAMLRERAAGHVGIHAELGARHGAALHPFFPPGVMGHPAMVLADRVHPNRAAIAAVADHLLPAVERALGSGA